MYTHVPNEKDLPIHLNYEIGNQINIEQPGKSTDGRQFANNKSDNPKELLYNNIEILGLYLLVS